MAIDVIDTYFAQHVKSFSASKKHSIVPFKDHPQFSLLVDILSRKESHDVLLSMTISEKCYPLFLEAFALYLTHENIPQPLRNINLLYIDLADPQAVSGLSSLRSLLDTSQQYVLFVIVNDTHEDKASKKILNILRTHPHSRFLFLTECPVATYDAELCHINMQPLSHADKMTVLTQQRVELEHFHQVVVPDELLLQAYAFAERFLSNGNVLQQTMLLLDSSCARAKALEIADQQHSKPVLTTAVLTQVLSSWTHIPATYLSLNKFKPHDFMQVMQQRIFGQEMALALISQALQRAHLYLHQHSGPFASFLFIGNQHSGKRAMAYGLADYLFKQTNMLYVAQLSTAKKSITELKLRCGKDEGFVLLKNAVQQKPYAIFMFEQIDKADSFMLEAIQEILQTGYLQYADEKLDFRQAIIIITSTLGAERIQTLTKVDKPNVREQTMDLMQILMQETKQDLFADAEHYSPQEFAAEITAVLTKELPHFDLHHLSVIPFIPLTLQALENIMRVKIKSLSRQLESRYCIELTYAPEVTRYLANMAWQKQSAAEHIAYIDDVLRHLYAVIEQAMYAQLENKTQPKQLFLQLNETGQLLRCDWVTMHAMRA